MSKPTKALIFNKYQIKKLIASTHFGYLYEGINIKENEAVAMKFERRISKYNLLESEAYFLFSLKGYGIPKLISYGKSGLFNVLIEELLGLSIQAIWNFKKFKPKYQLKDICMIAIQCIDRLEYIHSKDVIHRDIKPMNITVGKENQNLIYLIDFGFAHKYRSSRTGKHIRYKNIKKVLGSMRYLSINANKGYEQSRRDDLESLGYMLVYLAKNYLPWMDIEKQEINKIKKYKLVCASKIKNTPEILCSGLPFEFAKYLRYVKNLEFEQEPDYNFMRKLFLDALRRYHFNNDFIFSWILNEKLKIGIELKNSDTKSYNKSNSLSKNKRQNSQNRLYNVIKKTLETERTRSQDDNNTRRILNFDTIDENKNMNKIRNITLIDKQLEKKLEYISPKKEINSMQRPTLIYKRKKIQNIKITRQKNKNDINLNINNNYFKIENNINDIKNNRRSKKNLLDKANNFKNIIDMSNLINNKKIFKSNSFNIMINEAINGMKRDKKEIDVSSSDFKSRNTYKTLKERYSSNNCKNKLNNINNILEEKGHFKKILISNNIKNKNIINEFIKSKDNIIKNENLIPNGKKNNTSESSFNLNQNPFLKLDIKKIFSRNSKSPQNYNKGNNLKRYHMKNISYNNIDENVFKSNGLGFALEPRKRNSILSFNLSLNKHKYRPEIKLNKNYNINIINHKKINSSNNLLSNDSTSFTFNKNNNNYLKSFNYIPLSKKEEKESFLF